MAESRLATQEGLGSMGYFCRLIDVHDSSRQSTCPADKWRL